jgi:hypothetical protein
MHDEENDSQWLILALLFLGAAAFGLWWFFW